MKKADKTVATKTVDKPARRAKPAAVEVPTLKGKLGDMLKLLRRPAGATLEQMMNATGWQAHSVRGAMSGSLKKKQGLAITSEKTDGKRIYRVAAQ